MKKFVSCILLFTVLCSSAAPPDISEKILNAFNSTFTEAENVTWMETEDRCQANFNQNEVILRAVYDKEGTLLQTVRYYGASQLPANIKIKLNKHFPGKEIYGVTEILEQDELSFSILLKDKEYWYRVSSTSYAQLSMVEKFKRGEPESDK